MFKNIQMKTFVKVAICSSWQN